MCNIGQLYLAITAGVLQGVIFSNSSRVCLWTSSKLKVTLLLV